MLRIDPKEIPTPQMHQYLVGAIAPRPIAFVSTVSKEGIPNLAPYSFFNVFSSKPPILVFSSNRRVRGNSTKDTLHNVEETHEVVINAVTHAMVRQTALASIEYPPEVSEFEKAGFTPIESELVKPFRVKESPVQMECKVKDIVSLGDKGGAGNLVICEVLLMHVNKEVLDENEKINPQKIDLVGRMGRAFYSRAAGNSIFELFQPVAVLGIGVDQLPEWIKGSEVLTGNDLGALASVDQLPGEKEVASLKNNQIIREICMRYCDDEKQLKKQIQLFVKELVKDNELAMAWKVIMLIEYNMLEELK